jgi:hypothetical protein
MRVLKRGPFWAVAFANVGPASAGLSAVTKYERWKFGRPGGYSEKLVSPTRWTIKSVSTSSTMSDFALAMALHRAAIRTKASGFSHFAIVKLDITDSQYCSGCSFGNQVAYLTAVVTNDPAANIACKAKPKMAKNCGMHSAEETLSRYGPPLERSPQMQAAEIEELKKGAPAR